MYVFLVAKHLTAFIARTLDIKKNGSTMAFYNIRLIKKNSKQEKKPTPERFLLFARYFSACEREPERKSPLYKRPQFPNLALFFRPLNGVF